MDEEKRMIENYEVRHSVYLGDREILFAVDKDAAMPYLVSNCTDLGGFGLLRYENAIAGDDYLEQMQAFTQRIDRQIQQVREEREQRGIDPAPLTAEHCVQGGMKEDLEGKVIVIKASSLRPEYATADHQLMIENAATMENDESYKSPVDLLFDDLERVDPEHIAVKEYKVFKQASGKTAKSILVSTAVRLAAFNLPALANITSRDDLQLDTMGDRKRAIFAVIPDNDTSFNYLVGMLYSQAFQELYFAADNQYGGRLPMPVRVMMDEFANVALPDDFERILSTCRSREISINIVVQNMAQLKALFKDSWENVTGNCDTLLYLGGNEASTHEYISKALGKETIDTRTRGVTKGRSGSSNTNYQNAGRELLMPDEVRMLSNRKALVFIRGERPVMDEKYPIQKHPNFRRTADGGKSPYQKRYDIPHYERPDLPDTVDAKDVEILEFTEEPEHEKEKHFRTQGADQTGKTPLLHGGSLLGRLLRFCHARFGGRR